MSPLAATAGVLRPRILRTRIRIRGSNGSAHSLIACHIETARLFSTSERGYKPETHALTAQPPSKLELQENRSCGDQLAIVSVGGNDGLAKLFDPSGNRLGML
jgi:hypothetical protein